MSGALNLVAAGVIVLAVLLGVARLWLRRVRALPTARGPAWRAAALSVLQLSAGAALYLTLFPPGAASSGLVLAIAVAGAPKSVALAPGERLIALPEARATRGAERAPDLATALRRHPGVASIRVIGDGLAPRDREGSHSVKIAFVPPPQPRGLVRIALPGPIAAGNAFSVGGEIGTLREGIVELLDPAGALVSQARIKAGAAFRLNGTMRLPGLALFVLRVRDPSGRVIERLEVPIDAAPRPQPRVLVLAGAASAENKFLRRWAQDAGIDLALEIDAGGGVQLGDPATPLTSSALDQRDLVAIDDRRWESIGPTGRAALLSATERGMGLLLRLTGPPSLEVRRGWAALGFALSNPAGPALSAQVSRTLPEPNPVLPLPIGPNAIPLIAGTAAWTPSAQGRIGLLTLDDTYVLALTGRGDRHGQLWSTLVGTLARAEPAPPAWLDGFARAGSRVILCGLQGTALVQEPGGRNTLIQLDPASGKERCGGYWPAAPGWRTLRAGEREMHFYVHPAAAFASLAAIEASAATRALASSAAGPNGSAPSGTGALWSLWLWFALLLTLLTALWWLERTRFAAPPQSRDEGATHDGISG